MARPILIAVIALGATLVAKADVPIYRSVGAFGEPVFSDQALPGAAKVALETPRAVDPDARTRQTREESRMAGILAADRRERERAAAQKDAARGTAPLPEPTPITSDHPPHGWPIYWHPPYVGPGPVVPDDPIPEPMPRPTRLSKALPAD